MASSGRLLLPYAPKPLRVSYAILGFVFILLVVMLAWWLFIIMPLSQLLGEAGVWENLGASIKPDPMFWIQVVLGFAVLFLTVLAIAAMWAAVQLAIEFEQEAVVGPGTIIDKWVERSYSELDDRPSYFIDYCFSSTNGTWNGRDEVGASNYKLRQIGDPVRVRFLARDPRICKLE